MNEITAQPRKSLKKKSSRWYRRDSDAESDPKIIALVQREGWQAVAWYWLTLGALRDAADFHLDHQDLNILAWKFHIDEALWKSFIETALDLELLFVSELGISSERLLSDMGEMSEAGRKAGLASAESRAKRSASESVSTPVGVRQRTSTDNLISSPLILSRSDLSLEGAGNLSCEVPPVPVPEPEPEPPNPLEAAAEKYLEPIESEAVQRSRVFISCGRRPLKLYPNTWITKPEFVQLLEIYEKSGVKRSDLKDLLQACEAKMVELKAKGADPQSKSAFAWLSGFLLEDYLKRRKGQNDLKRSEAYLSAAEAVRV
jgi:hypothetical protein